jgi:hypothetical protein
MGALELVYDFFEDRAHATALIRQRRPLGLGFAALVLGATALFVAQGLTGRLGLFSFAWPSYGLALLWQFAAAFVGTAVLAFVLEMAGARGDAGALFVHLALSELVWTCAVPAVMIVQALSLGPWGVRLVFFLLGTWALTLKARGIRDEYGVGGGWAWATLGVPYLAAAVFMGLALVLAIASLVVSLAS